MKNCPTSNMNKSKLWGFEVSQIVAAFASLATSNVIFNIIGCPLIFSWLMAIGTLLGLRLLSLGQKDGHLELLMRFTVEPHLFLGHKERRRTDGKVLAD